MHEILKEIKYDRETRDYACYLNGELVGFARTYHDGEIALDELVYNTLTKSSTEYTTKPVDPT